MLCLCQLCSSDLILSSGVNTRFKRRNSVLFVVGRVVAEWVCVYSLGRGKKKKKRWSHNKRPLPLFTTIITHTHTPKAWREVSLALCQSPAWHTHTQTHRKPNTHTSWRQGCLTERRERVRGCSRDMLRKLVCKKICARKTDAFFLSVRSPPRSASLSCFLVFLSRRSVRFLRLDVSFLSSTCCRLFPSSTLCFLSVWWMQCHGYDTESLIIILCCYFLHFYK